MRWMTAQAAAAEPRTDDVGADGGFNERINLDRSGRAIGQGVHWVVSHACLKPTMGWSRNGP